MKVSSRRLQGVIAGCNATLLTAYASTAFAADATVTAGGAVTSWQSVAAKAGSAALVMALSAMSAGYAQAKIGSAGAGTLAERPEAGTNLIVLQALPEIIALLGFAIAFLILQIK